MHTERVKRLPFVEPLKGLPLMLLSLFVVVAAVDLLLILQPSILLALRSDWQDVVPNGSNWSTLLAATVIVLAIGLSATVLTWFVRGARAAPYLCLAPLWVGMCMLVIGRMQIELPLPLATPTFVAICALIFVGGGVLFETRSEQSNAAGLALSVLPILLLILGYLLSEVRFDMRAMLLLLVLAIAAAGAPAIAMACRANGTKLSGGRDAMPGEQMVDLLQRVRLNEERALRAERQLAAQPAWSVAAGAAAAPRLALDDVERPRAGRSWLTAAVAAAFVVALAGYFLGVAPLATELADQRLVHAKQSEQLNFEIDVLRQSSAREKRVLEERLAAAFDAPRTSREPGGTGPQASAALALEREGDTTGEDEARAVRAARRAARIARREQAAAERETRAAERATVREARAAARLEKRQARAEARERARAANREARSHERTARALEHPQAEDEDDAETDRPPALAAPEPARGRDSMEAGSSEDSDDPLQGLDGL